MGSSLQLFKNYRNNANIFIETGTFKGEGIEKALEVGFSKVYSCDINQEAVENAINKFSNQNVIVINQPSQEALKLFFNEINERCVVFLDGHFMPYDENDENRGFGEDTVKKGLPPCPLMEELGIIAGHHVKGHIILIDDYQCFGTWVFGGITLDQVNKKIFGINSNYKMSLFSNTVCYTV